jgi:hypothetical protein
MTSLPPFKSCRDGRGDFIKRPAANFWNSLTIRGKAPPPDDFGF